MNQQTEFPYVHSPIPLTPHNGKSHPKIWIERVTLHRSFPISKDTELRDIKLHRGLNILWAEPNRTTDRANARVRISGHATGKTTFCRFLRYLLGEERYGTDDFRRAFREKFKNQGWVFGEVWVNNRRWLVGRPLGTGAHPFAVQGPRIDSLVGAETLPQGGFFDNYLPAIDKCVLGSLANEPLPSSGLPLGWDMLLQWISRDQESRFAKLLSWRNSASESESVDLQENEKENIVRLILGLSTPDEQELMRKHAKAAKEHKTAVENRKAHKFQSQTEFSRISQFLEQDLSSDEPLPEILINDTIEKLKNQSEHLRSLKGKDDGIAEIEKKIEEIERTTSEAEFRWKDAKEYSEKIQDEIEIAEGKKTEADRKHKKRSYDPFRGYCSAKLTDEVLKECRFARMRKSDEDLDEDLKEIRSQADLLKYDKRRADAHVMELFQKLEKRRSEEHDLKNRLELLEKKYDSSIEKALSIDDKIKTIVLSLNNLKESQKSQQENESNILTANSDKETYTAGLENLKKQHGKRMGELSELFRFVIQGLLGPDVEAKVEFSGKSIQPQVDFHGRMDSAALETVRLLAFDITCLLDSYIRKDSLLPGFWIHDSPREADLSVDIYHEVFNIMRRMELDSKAKDFPFQYIITTTETPPKDLVKEPWLLQPVLNATEPRRRFLGVDV